MKDNDKTTEKLAKESEALRRRVTELEKSETEHKQVEKALRKSEEKYRGLVEDTHVGIVAVDLQGKLTFVNKALCQMTGYSEKEFLGQYFTDFLHPDDKPKMLKAFREISTSPKSAFHFEFRAIHKEGHLVHMYASPTAIKYQNVVVGFSSVVTDITELKRAEEAMRLQSEIVVNMREGILLTRTSNRQIIYANSRFEEMFGYGPGELTGKDVVVLNAADERTPKEIAEEIIKQLSENSVWYGEVHNIKKDGTCFWCRASISTFEHPLHGEVHVNVLEDITEHKQIEEALRESEERYRCLFDQSPEGISVSSLDGRLLYANEAMENVTGYTTEELKSINLVNLFEHPEDRKVLLEKVKRYGSVVDSETRLKRKDGTPYDVMLNVSQVHLAGEDVVQTTTVDITERKLAEEELRESRQQLRNLSAHLQSAREEERRLIAREIHDELGQTLTALKMDLSWLSKRLPQEQEPLFEKARAMSELLDVSIKTVKRISTQLRPGLLDDLGLIAAIEWQAGEFQERTGIKCKISLEPEDIVLKQELATAIFRIFQESLTNVARHAKATKVKISMKEKPKKLVLKIRDNGQGITQEQVSDSRSLGLVGMQERAHSWGGEVKISGIQGKGTTVTLSVPPEKGEAG